MISLPLITGNVNMAAVAARAARIVKPHIPSIKFPARAPGAPKDPASSSAIPKPSETLSSTNTGAQATSQSSSNNPSKGVAIEYSELPPKYRRKPLSAEEMEYIEKGGKV